MNAVRSSRAAKFLDALELAATSKSPVRVIVNSRIKSSSASSPGTSRVEYRLLDPVPWRVTEYHPTSSRCVLVRGAPSGAFVDQFSVMPTDDAPPERATVTAVHFLRKPALRAAALERAKGKCEYCLAPGFTMPDGRVFLETHHIIPLSEGGRDRSANLVALCANHHREAHHGARAADIRLHLLQYVKSIPNKKPSTASPRAV